MSGRGVAHAERGELLDFLIDAKRRGKSDAGYYLPGTRIPIHHPDGIRETKADYLLILPWNLREEIMRQMADIRTWGGQFVVPIPRVKVFD